MATKLSTALYDAEISGNKDEVEKIKNEINDRIKNSTAKPNERIVNFNTVFNNEKSSVEFIYDFLNKNLSPNWWEWETETIEHVLWIHYAVVLEGLNREKVFAIRHLCNSDRAFFDWYEFNQLALAFSGAMADFECLKKPSPGMAINAVKMMNYIRPDREGKFGGDIIRYICVLLNDDGIYTPPPSLMDMIKDRIGATVSQDMKDQWPKILERFSQLVKGENINIEDNIIDVQARRLLSAEASAAAYGS